MIQVSVQQTYPDPTSGSTTEIDSSWRSVRSIYMDIRQKSHPAGHKDKISYDLRNGQLNKLSDL